MSDNKQLPPIKEKDLVFMENGENITHTEDGITESPDNVTTERPGNVTGWLY